MKYDDENRSVLRYVEKEDNKGRPILKLVYLTETPVEEIERLNKTFPVKRTKR